MNSSSTLMSPTRRLYNWLMRAVDTPRAVKILSIVSFAESSIFPLPPDLMLIPMILSNRQKAWRLAFICSLTSILGGILGYALGYFLFESIGQWIINTYHLQESFHNFQSLFQEWGFWIIMAKGLTPIPYKLVTIASGVCELNFGQFILASVITRTARFYILATLVWYFGEWSKEFIEKYLGWILFASLVLIGVGFALVKYVS